jgi:hypothetical protein
VSIHKAVHDITERLGIDAHALAESRGEYKAGKRQPAVPRSEMQRLIAELERQMKQAAKDLEFEKAAALRDQMYELRAILVEDSDLSPLQKLDSGWRRVTVIKIASAQRTGLEITHLFDSRTKYDKIYGKETGMIRS